MTKKAVDIVLLPCEEGMDKAIELNQQLVKKFGTGLVLDKKTCLPHVSLAIGCISETDLPSIKEVLKNTARENPIGNLRIKGVVTSKNAKGEKVSSFEIEKSETLQKLHEEVMNAMEDFVTYDVAEKMLYGTEIIAESTLVWIKNFKKKSSFENFWPHITLGYGIIGMMGSPKVIDVSAMAICHLGNHCTCRKILTEFKI